eukprot:1155814-Pelagomonas_calceolata.AAC.5
MDSALHIFSDCQSFVIYNMAIKHHDIASSMILKVVSKGSYGPNLVHMDVSNADHLAQHDLSIPDQARRNSSRPDAILVTPCPSNLNRLPISLLQQMCTSPKRTKRDKKKGTRHAPRLGVLLGRINHMQMHAPARVSLLSKCLQTKMRNTS